MAGPVFFPNSWTGKELDFSWPQPSKWTTTKKISEKSSRLTPREVESPHIGGPKLSFAVGLFLCQNVNHPEQEAFIKVYKQVPHSGAEFESHAARKAQAGELSHSDIEAYKLFMQNQARYLPICLGYKMEHQDDFDVVPGGYVQQVVYSKLPGLRLDEERFWSFDETQREAICNAFLSAYKELDALGVDPGFHGLENLVWDEEVNTIYIVNFDDARPIALEGTDESVVCASWGLPTPRKDMKEEYKEDNSG